MYQQGFLYAALMLAQHGGKHRKPAEPPSGKTTVYRKTVYLPVIQPDPLPLSERKRLLSKKLKAKKKGGGK